MSTSNGQLVTIDTSGLQKLQDTLSYELADAVKQAHTRSISRAVTTGRAVASRLYQLSYPKAKISDIKDLFKSYIIRSQDRVADTAGTLEIKRRGLLIEKIGGQLVKTGVVRGQQRYVLQFPGAFGVVTLSGPFLGKVFGNNTGDHWWKRVAGGRFPVRPIYAPSPFTMFKYESNQVVVASNMRDQYIDETAANLNFYLTRAIVKIGSAQA